jgi:hypothetical protein
VRGRITCGKRLLVGFINRSFLGSLDLCFSLKPIVEL